MKLEPVMDEIPRLKLIKLPAELKSPSNFWQCCPLNKEYLPETSCPEGKPESTGGKVQEEPRCRWWINSADHYYCFWRYIKDKSDADGVMRELVQSELAALFGWSNTKTHFMLKQAVSELTEALKLYGAIELLQDLDSTDLETILTVEDVTDLPEGLIE